MRRILIILLSALPAVIFAQSAERQVVGTAGGYYVGSDLRVSSTVGQPVTATGTSATIILTQGFQQPGTGSLGIEDIETGLSVNAYPNPTDGKVILEMDSPNVMDLNIQVLDFNGTVISKPLQKQRVFGSSSHEIDFLEMAAGNYFLLLTNAKGNLRQTIKIVKVD